MMEISNILMTHSGDSPLSHQQEHELYLNPMSMTRQGIGLLHPSEHTQYLQHLRATPPTPSTNTPQRLDETTKPTPTTTMGISQMMEQDSTSTITRIDS